MHSIELLLDEATDRAVRDEWRVLVEAGLPSQGRHTGESNAPHVTLAARAGIDGSHDDELRAAMRALPLPLRFAGLVVFGAPPRGLVLARLVSVSTRILRFQEAVDAIVPPAEGPQDALHTSPGRWTPHVTLASRLTPEQLAQALVALDGRTPADGSFVAARRWDSTLREVTALG